MDDIKQTKAEKRLAAKEAADTRRRNLGSLPRWWRRLVAAKQHDHDREDARRRRQIEDGTLNPESRGTTEVR